MKTHRLFPLLLLLLTLLPLTAHAQAAGTSPPDPLSWLTYAGIAIAAVGGLVKVLEVLLAGLTWLAPRTKTTVDDTIRDDVRVLRDDVKAVLSVVGGLVPATGVPTATSEKPTAPATPQNVVSIAKAPAMLFVLLLGALTAQALTGCATIKSDAATIEAGVVTCAKGDIAAAKALGLQLGTEALADLLTGKTSAQIWAQVSTDAEAAAKTQGLAVASCGFGGLVAELDKLLHLAPAAGTTTQGLTANAAVDPLAGGRAALAAFAAAHQITRIDP